MATQRQLAANRRNAKKCTGPRTPEGKARSARNNLKHGLYSQAPVLPNEDPQAREQLAGEHRAAFGEVNADQLPLLDKLTETEWLLRRYAVIEASMWNSPPEAELANSLAAACRVTAFRTRATRQFQAALHELGVPQIPTAQLTPDESLNPELVSSRTFAIAYNR